MRKRNNKRLGINELTGHTSSCTKKKPCVKADHKHQQMITKELFLTWDGDGEGSLSQEELISAFIRIGLSSDHQFAKTIIAAIQPSKEVRKNNDDITLKDFIKIFRSDEVGESIINVINHEITLRRKLKFKNE